MRLREIVKPEMAMLPAALTTLGAIFPSERRRFWCVVGESLRQHAAHA